jgi:hypothetical protein
LNHPLNAYNGNQLNLYFQTDYVSKASTLLVAPKQGGTGTEPTFGQTVAKTGGDQRRILELSIKYAF